MLGIHILVGCREVRHDLINQQPLLVGRCNVESFLDHIVGVLVLHQQKDIARILYSSNNRPS